MRYRILKLLPRGITYLVNSVFMKGEPNGYR